MDETDQGRKAEFALKEMRTWAELDEKKFLASSGFNYDSLALTGELGKALKKTKTDVNYVYFPMFRYVGPNGDIRVGVNHVDRFKDVKTAVSKMKSADRSVFVYFARRREGTDDLEVAYFVDDSPTGDEKS